MMHVNLWPGYIEHHGMDEFFGAKKLRTKSNLPRSEM